MKTSRAFLIAAGLALTTVPAAQAQNVLVGWDVSGLSAYGGSPFAPTTKDANLEVVGFTRGSGVATSGTAATNGWGGTGWDLTTPNLENAIAANNFATFSVTVADGYELDISGFGAYNIRRSGTGPTTGQWQYQIGDGSFVNIGSAVTWGTTTSGTGNSQAATDFSQIAALQDIVGGSTVTFRVVNWSASASGGSWYINQLSSTAGQNDFTLLGSLSLVSPSVFGNYWAPVAGGGGSGTWSSSSKTWSETASPVAAGTASQATTGALVFGDAAGNITVSGTVTVAAGLSFVTDGYTLTGGTVSLTGADATANAISVDSATSTIINSTLSATNGFTKTGAGTLTLGGTNTLGAVTVSQGGLVLTSAGALGNTASGTTVDAGATLDLDGQTIGAEAIALSGVLSNGSLTTAASLAGAVTLTDTASISTTSGLTLTGGIAGSGSLTKDGAGVLTLSTANATHAAGTTISDGALLLDGVTHVSNISVASGATLRGSGIVSGSVTLASGATLRSVNASSATFTLGSLTANGGTISLDLADTLAITGALTLGGNVSLTLSNLGASPVAGTYNLLSFGSLSAGDFGITLDTSAPAGYSFSGVLDADSYSLTIELLARSLSWGGGNATWSVGGGNWTNDSTTAAATFENGDQVTFGSGISGGTVTVSEGVTFGAITVNTEDINLTFAGAGLAGAGNVALNGAGSIVTLNNANTFTGAVQVNAGKLIAANNAALGSTEGSTTVAAGAELSLEGGVTVTNEALSLAGTLSSGAGNNTFTGAITLTNNATLSAAADTGLTISGAITGETRTLSVTGDGTTTLSGGVTAASLTKSDAGTLTISAASTITGGTTLAAGVINANHDSAFGAGTLTLNGGALGNTSGSARSLANAVTVGGDFGLGTSSSTGSLTLSGAVNLGNAARTVTVADSGAAISGNVTNGSLAKVGTGTLTLSGSNTLGDLTINDGTLRLGSAGAVGGATVSFGESASASAKLQLNGQSATLTSLAGSGLVENDGSAASTLTLNASSATTLSASLADGTGSGTLALTKTGAGRLTLSSSSSHTGGTNLNEGSILATHSNALGAGIATVKDGTTLAVANGLTIANAINVRPSAVGGFIISEQVEGTSNNKYIELFNGTGSTLDLSQYQIANYNNGVSVASGTVNLATYQATLGAGEVLILRNSSAALTLPQGVTSYASTATFFGGDDAFALQRTDGTNIDIFGVIGSDPGTAWTADNGNTTINTTLVRNADVLVGVSTNPPNTTSPTGFLTLGTEWTQYPIDTVSNLGSHTMNLPFGVGATIGTEEESASVAFAGAVSLGSKAIITSAAGSTVTFSGAISGSAGFDMTGAGKVILSGTNTFSGASTLTAGTLELGSATALGTSVLTVTGGTLDIASQALGNTIVLDGGSITGTGNLTDAAELVIQSGTLAFVDLGTFGAAGLTLQGGTLDLSDLDPTNVITFVSGSFLNASNWSGVVSPTGTGDVTSQLAGLSGIGGGVLLGSGQSANLGGLSFNISSNGATLSGLGTYTGILTLTSGTQSFAGLGDLGFGLFVNSGATAQFGSGGLLCGSTTHFRSGGAILGSNYTGTVNVLGSNVSITGLNMTSSATLNVTTGNSITLTEVINNAITLNGGSIDGLNLIGGQLTLLSSIVANTAIGAFGGNSSVVLGAGGRLGGNATILGNLSQQSGSILGPGNSPGIIQVQGNVTLAAGAIYEVEAIRIGSLGAPASAGTDYDTTAVFGDLILSGLSETQRYIIRLVSIDGDSNNVVAEDFLPEVDFDLVLFSVAGTIDLGGNTLSDLFTIETDFTGKSFLASDGITSIDASRFSVSLFENNVILSYSAIPEPSTYGLILGGLALAGAAIRRRRKQPA